MHEQKVTQSNHYSSENKRDNSDLIITDIKEDDAGIYICQINTEPIRNKVNIHIPIQSKTLLPRITLQKERIQNM